MIVKLNGQPLELAARTTLADAVARLGGDTRERGIAVALDGEVVPRERWGSTALAEGQAIEVVRAVQGG